MSSLCDRGRNVYHILYEHIGQAYQLIRVWMAPCPFGVPVSEWGHMIFRRWVTAA